MGRKAKDPEIRRMELILAAEKLFKEKGFEDTSVSDITDAVGVSHGTFFYYFASKNEVLKAVINYYVGQDKELLEKFAFDDSMSAMKKIQMILDISLGPQEQSANSENKLVQYLHNWLGDVISFISFESRFEGFAKGLIDTRAVVYFLSVSVLCLLVAFRSLESRKWS